MSALTRSVSRQSGLEAVPSASQRRDEILKDTERLQQGHVSILRNPDIAHALYLQGYREKLGRGSVLIRQACEQTGLPAPLWHSEECSGVTLTFFAPEVAPEVERLIKAVDGDMKRAELQRRLKLTDAEHFRKHYLAPALEKAVIVMTIPGKPTSSNQRYRLTRLENAIRARLENS